MNLTADGRQALLELSKGDMRRALNVLQACHSAFDVTDEAAVYDCTGNPYPADVETIVHTMMHDSFESAFQSEPDSIHRSRSDSTMTSLHHTGISQLKMEKGLALQDIIAGVYDVVATLELKAPSHVYLLDQLAQVEHRLSTGGSEKLQLTSLLGAMKM